VIRVVVADDHPLLREGIARLLRETPDLQVVGEAGNGDEAVDLVAGGGADVLVLDLAMPGRGGFDVLARLRSWPVRPRVLVLSAHPEDQLAVRTLKAGAAGYLSKESAPEELVKAIRRVAEGLRYVTPAVAELLARSAAKEKPERLHETLAPREFEVFLLVARGKRLAEIARALGVSRSTARTLRQRVLFKLELANDAEVARYAVENGLLG